MLGFASLLVHSQIHHLPFFNAVVIIRKEPINGGKVSLTAAKQRPFCVRTEPEESLNDSRERGHLCSHRRDQEAHGHQEPSSFKCAWLWSQRNSHSLCLAHGRIMSYCDNFVIYGTTLNVFISCFFRSVGGTFH